VVLISLVSTGLKPKMFAGLFGAAPSVAVASLLVTSLVSFDPREQPRTAWESSAAMSAC
jgi:hypothetical protein